MSYKRFGILLDCSANGVPNVNMVKRLIRVMEKMGYNFLELCMDDIYKIDNEPYFGYLRGGYTNAELKEMDAFAKAHGVELIPCVQTLAHLTNLVKLPHYSGIVDIADILLIDEPRTYELIENMFKALRAGFTTNLVNIGFDEAHLVGLGRYLDKHGYVNRYDLLFKHLNRVLEIAAKYGTSPQSAYEGGCPPVYNDEKLVSILSSNGFDVQNNATPTLAGEDFSIFGDFAPSVMLWLGIGDVPPLHNEKFFVPTEVLPTGVELWCKIANYNWKDELS